ncbi:MAG: SDR family NAD(P)-dependent oxidoreductase [Saprospiraceae bacterium]
MNDSKVAIVSGASSGVGEALAPLLAVHGYTVYGLSRRSVKLPGVIALPADITDVTALENAVQTVIAAEGRLDAVLHCAGIGGAGPVEQMPAVEARKIVETNYWGSWNLARACLPHLRARGAAGHLFFVSSIAGLMGIPYRSAYCASKAAVIALTEALRLEVSGTPLRVSCICPGDIATNSIATQYRMPYTDVDPLYRPTYQKADEGMAANVNHGMTAAHVAESIRRIMQKDRPKPVYVVGEPVQRASTWAKRLLPGWVFERVLMKYYG